MESEDLSQQEREGSTSALKVQLDGLRALSPSPALSGGSASPSKKAAGMGVTPGKRMSGLSPVDILSKLTLSVKRAATKVIAGKTEDVEDSFDPFDPDIQDLDFKTLYDR